MFAFFIVVVVLESFAASMTHEHMPTHVPTHSPSQITSGTPEPSRVQPPTVGPTQTVHGWAILDRYEGDECSDGTVVLSSGVPTNVCIATQNKVSMETKYFKLNCDSANGELLVTLYSSYDCSGNVNEQNTHTYSEGCAAVTSELSTELGDIFELYGYNSTKLTCSGSRNIPIIGPYVLYEGFPSKQRCQEEDAVLYDAFKTGYCFHTAENDSVRFEKNEFLDPFIDGWFSANMFYENECHGNDAIQYLLPSLCTSNADDGLDFEMALNYSAISYNRFRYYTNGDSISTAPTLQPSPMPVLTVQPSVEPTNLVIPSLAPTYPSTEATSLPTFLPTTFPLIPSTAPTRSPTAIPSSVSTDSPSNGPSEVLTNSPSTSPSTSPTESPTTNDGVVSSIGSATTGGGNDESKNAIIASVCVITVIIILVAMWFFNARKKKNIVDNAFKGWLDPSTSPSTATIKEGISDAKGPVTVYNVNPMHVQLQERKATGCENADEGKPSEIRTYSIARRSLPTVQEETEEIDHRPISSLHATGTNYDDQMANDEMERTKRRQLNARPSFVKKYNFFEDVAEGIITHKDIRTNKDIAKDVAEDV